MAGCNIDKRPLKQSELEDEAQNIMSYGLDSDNEFSDNGSEHSDHQTDTEEECDDSDEIYVHTGRGTDSEASDDQEDTSGSRNYFYGKNRFKWAKNPPASSRTRKHNLISHLPGIIGKARDTMPEKPIQAWECIISDDILQ